jgi:hypothetical protein
MDTAEQFWSHVQRGRAGDCWEWQGGTYRTGYGQVRWRGKGRVASRVAAFLAGLVHTTSAPRSRLSSGFVLHRCDNRKCCNPRHLYVGTYRDNTQDSIRKGRYRTNFRPMPGVANGRAVLTPRQIETIRGLYSTGRYTQQQLAQHFGVVQPHISRIIRLEQWT